ncbi:MAG: hypothetical protein JKX74_00925 [Flavobacteriales bacterium]|nr:hypothetical protein [Flavobacteriales bacterium]
MKTILSLGIILALATTIFSCKKYPEGPALSLRSKKGRVANKWKIDKWFIGGVDSAMYYAAEGTWIELTKDGKASAVQVQKYGTQSLTTTFTGNWQFVDDKEVLGWVLTDDLTNTADATTFDILKLKEKEMWLLDEDDNANKTEEIRLIPY